MIALGAAGGFYVDRFLQRGEGDLELRFPDSDTKLVSAVAAGQDYGRTAVTEAETFENHLHTEGARTAPTANARSGTGADKVALKITNDGKGILLLSASDVDGNHSHNRHFASGGYYYGGYPYDYGDDCYSLRR